MDQADRAICDEIIRKKVISLIDDRHIDTILTYVSFRSEVDTYGIIRECLSHGIKVAVPRVEKPDIRFCYIDSEEDLVSGYMGIYEPAERCMPFLHEMVPSGIEKASGRIILIVPGSVYDTAHNRIGYGGGYYDRFMNKYPDIYSIGLAYSCQMTDEIPTDQWDQKVDIVITDEETY